MTNQPWLGEIEIAGERRRPRAEVIAAIRRVLRRLVKSGPRAAVRELRASSAADEAVAAYDRWIARHTPGAADLARMREESERLPYRPLISLITPVYNTDPRWLRACIDSVRAQVYSNWELCLCDDGSTSPETIAVLDQQRDPRIRVTRLERNAGISTASNAALATVTGELVALLDHDDELTPDALYEVVRHLNASPDTDIVYSDEDKRDPDLRLSEPFFKPDWSPEHLLSAMYTCHLTVARKALVDGVGGFRVGYEGAQDHDLMLRLSEVTSRIHHLPKILYHWRRTPESTASAGSAKPWADDSGRRALQDFVARTGTQAEVVSGGVPGLYRVRFAVRGEPVVTMVVVGARENARAHDWMAAATGRWGSARLDLIELNNEPSLVANINSAVRLSAGAHVLVVDATLIPEDDEWVGALLEYSQQDAIGAAGAKIQYADGRLRHIGVITCIERGPARALHGHAGNTYGYFSSAIGVRNYSAVSGECLMTRREVFDGVGGFNEQLPWSGADVDYCLRVRQAGKRVVFTPYARLRRPAVSPPAELDEGARAALRAVWGPVLDADPYYNVNLSRRSADYLLDALAAP